MATQISADSFLTCVRQSGLVPEERLQKALDAAAQAGAPDNPRALAGDFVRRGTLTRWQADKLLQGRHKGFFLGKYRLLSLLGKGGMSAVYLAEHTVMRRRCAIKVLPAKRVRDTSYLGRFHREAQAVASLDHANIVRAYDVDHEVDGDNELHFLVMEYVEGRSLHEVVQQDGPLPFAAAIDCLRQAAEGLEHAHRAGLVHRDIKPGNLLMDRHGTVKILDLGLARFFGEDDETSLTVAHDEKVLGTADYLAPEQALDSHTVDARADIYSLGCTLFFLLTGSPPFTAGTLAQRLLAHQTKAPPPLIEKRADAPASVTAIVEKLMAKRRDDRYQTAAEVAEVATAWLAANGEAPGAAAAVAPAPPSLGRSPSTKVNGVDPDSDTTASPADPAAGEAELAAFLQGLGGGPTPGPLSSLAPPSGTAPVAAPDSAAKPPASGKTPRSGAKVAGPPSSAKGSGVGQPSVPPSSGLSAAAGSGVQLNVSQAGSGAPAEPNEADADNPFAFLSDDAAAPRSAIRRRRAVVREPKETPAASRSAAGPATASAALGLAKLPKWLIAAITVGTLLVTVVVALLLFRGDGKPEPAGLVGAGGGVDPLSLIGKEIVVGPGGQFATLKAALDFVKEHYDPADRSQTQVVRVVGGGTFPEAILADNHDFSWPAGLRIVSDSPPATLAPPGDGPVLTLHGLDRVSIEGFNLECAGRAVVVQAGGVLAETSLKKLTLLNLTRVGLQGEAVAGGPGRYKFAVENVTIRGGGDAVGVRLSGATKNAALQGVKLLGPMTAGVVIDGSADVVEVRDTIFADMPVGLKIAGNARLGDFTLVNNTFYKVGRGVVFETPPADGSAGLTIRRNLFAKTGAAEAVVAGGDAEAVKRALAENGLAENLTTRGQPETGGLDLFAPEGRGVKAAFAETDPGRAKFLAPADGAAVKVGDGYAGAVRP